jgi:hypothetical protein
MDKVSVLYKHLHSHAGPREVIARGMGYASLNGSSMSVISALNKYGLLEGRGDEIKISDRAMRIMHPESQEERAAAIREAASEPQLFAELDDRFPGATPNEELLRNYLLRKNFAPGAVSQVILAYRETKELVEADCGGYDSPSLPTKGPAEMQQPSAGTLPITPSIGATNVDFSQFNERSIARYDFEGGGYIRILTGGDVPTEEALDMAETIIELKRREIRRRKGAVAIIPDAPEKEAREGNEGENNA